MSIKSTLLFLLLSAFSTGVIFSKTINVPGDFASIQDALDTASTGDTVLVQPGIYYENIIWPTVSGIRLISAGDSSNTIIDGNANGRVIYINGLSLDTLTYIKGFTIRNGYLGNLGEGGGMYIKNSGIEITEVLIYNNIIQDYNAKGGGIYLDSCNVILKNVIVSNNKIQGGVVGGGQGGGIYIVRSNVELEGVQVLNNFLTGNGIFDGGGIFIGNSSALLSDVKINYNTIYVFPFGSNAVWGLGMSIKYSYVNIHNLQIKYNTLKGNYINILFGGVIDLLSNSNIKFKNVNISYNVIKVDSISNITGGIVNNFSSIHNILEFDDVNINNNTINSSISNIFSGGILNLSSINKLFNLNIYNNSITNNITAEIISGGILNIRRSNEINNITVNYNTLKASAEVIEGGVIHIGSNSLFTNATINNNTVNVFTDSLDGGILYLGPYSLITNTTVYSNNVNATSENINGGILFLFRNAQINDLELHNNILDGISKYINGGIMYVMGYPQQKIDNISITFNHINGSNTLKGSGIFITNKFGSYQSFLTNVFIAKNRIKGTKINYGGGIFIDNTIVNLTNLTIANNHHEDSININGKGIWVNGSSGYNVKIKNTISWNPHGNSNEIDGTSTGLDNTEVSYSNIRGGWSGTGNINSNPLFVSDNDFRLLYGSPSINTGTPDGAPETDIQGVPRKETPDMGAYESIIYTTVDVINSYSCFGICNGKVKLNIKGGKEPFTYILYPPNDTVNFADLSNLCPDIYGLTIIDSIGYKDSVSFEIKGSDSVYFVSEVSESISASDTAACQALTSSFSFNSHPALDYYWSFYNDGQIYTSNDTVPEITFTDTGYYDVHLIVTDNQSCADTIFEEKMIYIAPNPVSGFEAEDTIVCQYIPFEFTDTSQFANIWYWDFGDGNNSDIRHPLHTYTQNGNVDVQLIASNAWCSDTAYQTVYIKEAPMPGFNLTANEFCTGETIQVSSFAQGNINKIYYTDGKGDTVYQTNPVFTYNNAGVYTITQFVEGTNNCIPQYSRDIIVYSMPLASFSLAAITKSCGEVSWYFENESIDADEYYWILQGDTNTSQQLSYTFTESGTYHLELIALNGVCKDVFFMELEVEVRPKPEIDFTASDTLVCAPAEVHFANLSRNADQFIWDFGTGNELISDDTLAVSFLYEESGIYSVSLTAFSEEGCEETFIRTQYIHVLPEIDKGFKIAGNNSYCEGETVSLTAPDGYTAYFWSNGIIDTSGISVTSPGIYYVVVENEAGCSDTSEMVFIHENPQPEIYNQGADAICPEDHTTIATTQSYKDYLWSDNSKNPDLKITRGGTYHVTVTDENGCEGTSGAYHITEYQVPLEKIKLAARRDTVSVINPHPALVRYEWYIESGLYSETTDPYITTKYPGLFNVIAFTAENCKIYSDTIEVIFHDFILYPNPNDGRFIIEAMFYENTNFVIYITDMLGRVLYSLKENDHVGVYIRQFELSFLPKGFYVVRMEAGGRVYSEKVVVE